MSFSLYLHWRLDILFFETMDRCQLVADVFSVRSSGGIPVMPEPWLLAAATSGHDGHRQGRATEYSLRFDAIPANRQAGGAFSIAHHSSGQIS